MTNNKRRVRVMCRGRGGGHAQLSRVCVMMLLMMHLSTMVLQIQAQATDTIAPRCSMTTAELVGVGKETVVAPCILHDTHPAQESDVNNGSTNNNTTSVVTVVGVFDSACGVMRDGAMIAVEMLNGANGGSGASIGYNRNHFLKFRLVIGIVGNAKQQTPVSYKLAHQHMLEGLIKKLSPQYILGSCSFYAKYDKEIAGRYKTMVLSQVGPQKFYQEDSNEHVFGVHIPSDLYGIPAFQSLAFANKERGRKRTQKLRIIHRDRSEFFKYTCRAVYERALEEGFVDTIAIEYNPEDDEDEDGLLNWEDEDYMHYLADQACHEDEALENVDVAIWVCVQHDYEINTILDRLRENGCLPSLFWTTKASSGWSNANIERVPYFQAGAQWHKSMVYSDEFFKSGQAMLDYLEARFGYFPSYSATGSYHSIYIMYQNLWRYWKTQDAPQVELTFRERYEELRRNMLDLSLPETLYGPTIFDADQRNVGRGSAASQWLIKPDSSSDQVEMVLVSPDSQATAAVVFPAPSSESCQAGSSISAEFVTSSPSLLESKCKKCPAGTYSDTGESCLACPGESGTDGEMGAEVCVTFDQNLVPSGLIVLGLVIASINLILAVGFGAWTIHYRKDPVVDISQKEFLLLLCIGSIISSSSIVPLSIQAGEDDDTTAASRACLAVPFLYVTGWTLQYGALFAKSFRLWSIIAAAQNYRQIRITAKKTLGFVALILILNWMVLIPWMVVDPFTWKRFDLGVVIGDNFITHESIGRCSSDHTGLWVGILFSLQVTLAFVTNVILWKLGKRVDDRYQESTYISLASFFAFELLVLGIPILIAVGDSSGLRYLTILLIIALSDTGILLLVFVPKVKYQREGLPENTTAAESVWRVTGASSARSKTRCNQVRYVSQESQEKSDHQKADSVASETKEGQDKSSVINKSSISQEVNTGSQDKISIMDKSSRSKEGEA